MAGAEVAGVKPCSTYWGSHGCFEDEGHELPHRCMDGDDPCSEHDGTNARFMQCAWDDGAGVWVDVGWGEWVPLPTFK